MLDYDIEKSILELSLRKTSLQKEIEEIDLQIAFLTEQKHKQENWCKQRQQLIQFKLQNPMDLRLF